MNAQVIPVPGGFFPMGIFRRGCSGANRRADNSSIDKNSCPGSAISPIP